MNKSMEAIKQIKQAVNNNYDKYTRPVAAFVTFNYLEAKELFLEKYITHRTNFIRKLVFDNEKFLEVTDAPYPTNIIWENLAVS